MTELVGPDVLAVIGCGCTVTVEDDGLHIHPCCDEHRVVHEAVAAKFASELGIPFEVVG
jgi:hypothetical protein